MATVRTGNRAALVVVDVQAGVMARTWDTQRVVANISHAVAQAREQGVPVIWVQHDDNDMPRGSPQWQIVPELVPLEGEARVFKRYESSFEDTTLEQELARLGVTRIVLAGAMTNWCIRATAYGSLDRGYDLTLVKDAHTTGDIELANGGKVPAAGIVTDLNVAMTWLTYPGRKTSAVEARQLDFS
jgi:nicotinamidase-related amidase